MNDSISLSKFLELVELESYGIDLHISAHGGVCQLELLLPDNETIAFSVVNRANKMMAWGLDRQEVVDNLDWAIKKYHKLRADMFEKLYNELKTKELKA